MTPKTETIEDSEESDDKTTATAPEADDEGIVIGGCRQRSPRIMYVLTIASFLILVSLGIGMYFLYQRIEEKNHVIDRLESRLYAQQEAAERVDAQPAVAVKDTIVPNDSLRAAELHAAEKAKKDSIAASKSAAEAKASQVFCCTLNSHYTFRLQLRYSRAHGCIYNSRCSQDRDRSARSDPRFDK